MCCLAYAFDAVVRWSPDLLFKWLEPRVQPPGRGRTASMRWYPIVTFEVGFDVTNAPRCPSAMATTTGTLSSTRVADGPPHGWTPADTDVSVGRWRRSRRGGPESDAAQVFPGCDARILRRCVTTEWAAELASTYAPDVNARMIGAAMGGVLVDPAHNLHYIENTYFWAGVMPLATSISGARRTKLVHRRDRRCIDVCANRVDRRQHPCLERIHHRNPHGVSASRAVTSQQQSRRAEAHAKPPERSRRNTT